MTTKAIIDERYSALLLELHAEGLTREQWDSLIDRVEALVDETGLRHLISPFLRVGGSHGWDHPRYP